MRLFNGFFVVVVLGTGLSLRAQTPSMTKDPEAPPPPPARTQTQEPQQTGSNTHSPNGAMRISGGVMAGRLVKKVPPEYPSDVEAEGTVVLHAIIGTDGKVQQLSVISGPESLQPLAVKAVQQWEYQPFEQNGQPTAVDTTIEVDFRR